MTLEEYVGNAIRTESRTVVHVQGDAARVLHAAMGCVTEAGEMMDQIKRHVFYGKPLDEVNLVEEAGDLLWYLAILSHALDAPLADVMERNIAKLRRRYPDKFTQEDALNRDLTAERDALESTASAGIEGELREKGWTPLDPPRDPVCREDVGDGTTTNDRPRPGASLAADAASEGFNNGQRERAYLETNGWSLLVPAEGTKVETWTINWGKATASWPARIAARHADRRFWSREDALNLQREIDWLKGV